jgi:hypothetical protein
MGPYVFSTQRISRAKVNHTEKWVRTKLHHGGAHLVQLFRTYVWAVCEPKVDETPFSKQVFFCEWLAIVGHHFKWATDVRTADGA